MGGLESAGGEDDFFIGGENEGDAAEIADIDLHPRRGFGPVEDDALGQCRLVDDQVLTREAVLTEEGGFGRVPFECLAVDGQKLIRGTEESAARETFDGLDTKLFERCLRPGRECLRIMSERDR